MKSLCVYCGSSPGRNPRFKLAAQALGQCLAERDIGLVYGGASVGIMGTIADTVLALGGRVTGVIPQALNAKEIAHPGLSALHVVASMHERKALMAELSDGFIALPGGWGTLEEIFEVLTWAQLGFHSKPCGLLNESGYYDHLRAFLEHAFEQQFVRGEYRPMLMVHDTAPAMLDAFADYRAPKVRKWITADET